MTTILGRARALAGGALVALLGTACGGDPAAAGGGGGAGAGGASAYDDDAAWLCRPGLAGDVCTTGLDSTVVHADGAVEVEPHVVATDPPFDCFYLYPTVNFGTEGNAPLDGEYAAEIRTTRLQAGRLSAVCAVYAPLYRQVTLGSFGADDVEALRELAFADVLAAWDHYRAHRGADRGVVLIGHSQGAGLVNRLIRERLDDDEGERARLIAAYVAGATVAVPAGADVGGDFDHVPACRAPGDRGCVVSWASFRATEPPPASSRFGVARAGFEALCNVPAALAGGSTALHGYYPADAPRPWQPGAGGAAITTPFIQLPGLVSGQCVSAGGVSYLELTITGDPATPRVDDITGDLSADWGMHLVDITVTMGDLVALVRQQGATR